MATITVPAPDCNQTLALLRQFGSGNSKAADVEIQRLAQECLEVAAQFDKSSRLFEKEEDQKQLKALADRVAACNLREPASTTELKEQSVEADEKEGEKVEPKPILKTPVSGATSTPKGNKTGCCHTVGKIVTWVAKNSHWLAIAAVGFSVAYGSVNSSR